MTGSEPRVGANAGSPHVEKAAAEALLLDCPWLRLEPVQTYKWRFSETW